MGIICYEAMMFQCVGLCSAKKNGVFHSWGLGVAGSNPVAPTNLSNENTAPVGGVFVWGND